MAKIQEIQRATRFGCWPLGLIIGLGAYWAGSRYGQHNPASVQALPRGDWPADEASDERSIPPRRKMCASTSRLRRRSRIS